ncbi:winged helix-turn-helix domain-containing protein [Opitutaceae bacterium TAV4]|nr:winged helix-turn-helix domain-containing protein [Opitutaceae bacterium TAV4]RRK00569.1 winged helix-turn-helix domain-containing protein [Opitutaceae bacterium TAV3]
MSVPAIKVTVQEARRFMRRVHFLDTPAPGVAAVLAHHGYIQIDPINVCGRMHDLILRNRVAGYTEGGLMRHLHGEENKPQPATQRTAFEHHLPSSHILVAFPQDAWPHLLGAMEARTRSAGAWSGRLTPREKAFAPDLLTELAARGPLSSEDLHDGRRSTRGWGASTLAKSTLQKLFFHGRVLIAARRAQRRYYALPERVLPAATLALPRPDADETARWLLLTRLRQHRLVRLKKNEFPLIEDCVQRVVIDGALTLYCLREDTPLFDERTAGNANSTDAIHPAADDVGVRLLAPLDPLIYDRRVTSALWDFDYTWEVYTPAHKRVRGYYALPVLAGSELVGHVDPKADRAAGRLLIQGRSIRRGHSIAAPVKELARFLGVR